MYSSRITRLNPTAFVILIDQSGSMEEQITFDSIRMSKSEAVTIAANMLISELVNRSRREDGIRDYFDIAAIGYSNDRARSLLCAEGTFTRPSLINQAVCRTKLYTKERTLPNGHKVVTTTEQKLWIEPCAEGGTPMYDAFVKAHELVEKWCRKGSNLRSYPPTIFNITDGEASDCSDDQLIRLADKIKSIRTEDGNVLLINMHLSGSSSDKTTVFPSEEKLFENNKYAQLLFRLSSTMPANYEENIVRIKGTYDRPPFRGMSFNTSIADIIAMMNIGSISVSVIQ